MLPRSIRL
ncbi:unnamed protein product [Linum tenue]|uniref:Uncharacterized protein n=1 Tax=Linum tenue TaxID=586396 RepID=A0AAV0K7A1_9ROSI|nr:unnamed protein product [Linum tenue]